MNVERSLRALGAEDRSTAVPAHVGAAVMSAWDAHINESHRRARHRVVRVIVGTTVMGACAASLVAVIGIPWGREDAVHAVRDSAPIVAAVPGITTEPLEPVAPFVVARQSDDPVLVASRTRRPRPAAVVSRLRSGQAPEQPAEYVLLPREPLDSPLTMIRVRMERRTFARLGVPIANPDGDGMVDVEMLVGEDGVARSIRRATAVGWSDGY